MICFRSFSACFRKACAIAAGLAAFTLASPAHAKLLRILHTNDLHSHFEDSGDPARGSYAGIRLMMDTIRRESEREGIEVIALDAGDFSEGSPFFLAGQGEESIRVMNAMGFDAVALGNHDWLMGMRDLDALFLRQPPAFPLLGANFIINRGFQGLSRTLKPWIEINRGGIKIAILGLTTAELFYRWRVDEGFIADPIQEADRDLAILRPRNDVVIGLTHLGVADDRRLVRDSRGFDVIVGGHSHTKLETPVVALDRDHHSVPIVQAGCHGAFLGELLLDVTPGQKPRMISYQLIPIYKPEEPIGGEVEKLVANARVRLEAEYPAGWLYEVIGQTDVPLEPARSDGRPSPWANFVGEAMRESTGAEIALNSPEFFGVTQPPGPVTREKIIASFPRVFENNQRNGWHVWEVRVSGLVIKQMVSTARSLGQWPDFTGVTYDEQIGRNGKRSFVNYQVNGQPLENLRIYRMAVPEGMARGVFEITPIAQLLFRDPRDGRISVWDAIERRLRQFGRVIHGKQ